MDWLPRTLIVGGLVLLGLGVLLHVAPSLPLLGRLPGDIRIERPGLRIYLPITSCIVLSLLLSGLAWLVTRLR